MEKKKFPQTIYAVHGGNEKETWLEVDDSVDGHAVVGEARTIGVYALVRVAKLTATPKLS